MKDDTRFSIYDAHQLETVLGTMADRLAALLTGERKLAIVGVLRRGAPLAGMLAERLARRGMPPTLRMDLTVKRYGDDLSLLYPQTRLAEDPAAASADLSGTTVLVVDDVLYRGHSLLRVVQHLVRHGPARILTTVLVDRGVSLLPIHADVAGLRLDMPAGSIVEVHVPPYEPDFSIELVRAPATSETVT
jgi:pyrimidine operon attenuation protein/uracil phosphoribosyltransferase